MEYTYIHNHQSQFLEWFGNPKYSESSTSLNECCLMKAGKAIKATELITEGFPCYGGNGLRGFISRYSHEGEYPIIGRQGALCGNVIMAKGQFYATEHAIVVTPKDNVTAEWLFYCLLYMDLNRLARGVAQPGLSVEQLLKQPINIQPLNLQEEFAAFARQADKSKFDGFKSQFIEWFGDVEYIPLKNVCLRIGEYGSNTPATDYDGSVRYLRITDINDDGSLGNEIVSPSTIEEKYYLQTNDFVFARTGNTVGKTYLHTSGKMIYAGYLIRYKLDETCVLPKFLLAYTHTSLFWDWVSKMKKVGAQPNISAQQYNELPIPRAEIASQQRFVSIAEQADKSKYYEINETIYGIL